MAEAPLSHWRGSRLRLRALEPDDADALIADQADSETARLGNRLTLPLSLAEMRKEIERTGLNRESCDDFSFAVEDLEGQLVGRINTHGCDRVNGVFHYGLQIFGEHRRRGYASEAITLVLGFYFSELPYEKVETGVYAFNEASLGLHRRLGFVEEGRLRQSHLTGGRRHDVLLFGMTRGEFEQGRRTGSQSVRD